MIVARFRRLAPLVGLRYHGIQVPREVGPTLA